jgi:hypothetical protein
LLLVEVTCADAEAYRRLRARAVQGQDVSDARIEIYERQRERLRTSPPGLPDGALHVVLDTTRSDPALLDPVFDLLHRHAILAAGIDNDPVHFRAF